MTHKHNPDEIHQLATDTIRHLNSGQVIVHLDNVVKELVENALDAKATSIEVKLVENGLTSLSVKDNGVGIRADDRPNMAKRYHTSKLLCFEDLIRVTSYGFR
ncbi:histidine kinase-like ATPase, partial [Endogone sp. FLAS-F59071]